MLSNSTPVVVCRPDDTRLTSAQVEAAAYDGWGFTQSVKFAVANSSSLAVICQ